MPRISRRLSLQSQIRPEHNRFHDRRYFCMLDAPGSRSTRSAHQTYHDFMRSVLLHAPTVPNRARPLFPCSARRTLCARDLC